MTLKLYNTRTRKKEVFKPLDPKAVRMYVCGPTVYDFAHIGNARPVIIFDVLFRLLQHLAKRGAFDGGRGETKVVYVRNITDLDDKINARAAEEGISIRVLTERTAAQYHADVAALGALPPTAEPRATEHIREMIALVEQLIARGYAYAAEGHVLFNVPSDPDYGLLARRSTEEMRAGARVEVAPYKRDPMDFVLWKPSHGSEPGWESPWGYGRPGWHLECSAMAKKHLGDVFDIHGGGIDLLFPHHENEVAQSTCAHGTPIMANIWMHNGHLQVEGQKMSKSLGNFVTIHDIVAKGRMSAAASRLAMLSTHYRQPMDWTAEKIREAAFALDKFMGLIADWKVQTDLLDERISGPLLDDLNTPSAIAGLHEVANEVPVSPPAKRAQRLDSLANALDIMGFGGFRDFSADRWAREQVSVDVSKVEELKNARLAARKARNWAEADRIRDELSTMGIALKDAKNPITGEIETTWEIAR